MNRRTTIAARGGGARSAVGTAGVFVVLAAACLALVLAIRARPSPEPYDPTSGRPDGTRALVELLDRFGGTVRISETVPAVDRGDPTSNRLLVLRDRLDPAQTQEVDAFARAGGAVVVADPDSALGLGAAPPVFRRINGRTLPTLRLAVGDEVNVIPAAPCSIEPIEPLRGIYVPSGVLFDRDDLAATDDEGADGPGTDSIRGCLVPRIGGEGAFAIAFDAGDGQFVRLGDIDIWTNTHLRRADNAALAVALLTPNGATDVTVLIGTGTDRSVEAVGAGEERLRDLVPAWIWVALIAAAGAFVVFATGRAVRPVKVLDEPVAVPLAASGFVEATGLVMERAGHHARAASVLQHRFRQDLCEALDLPPTATDDQLAQRAQAGGLDADALVALTHSQDVTDARTLAEYTRRLDRARRHLAVTPTG